MTIKPIKFGDDTPGTILHDFQAMIDIIPKEGLRSAGTKGLFPMDHLSELDARLSLPFKPKLKRPQLRSYPNLTGLYMLLRSSGMGLIEGDGSGQRLVLNEALLSRWQQLSPADRYWNLLGVWWALSRTTGISNRDNAFSELLDAMRAMDTAVRRPVESLPAWVTQVCLAGMFGMAEFDLDHRPRTFGLTMRIRYTPIGTQLRRLIAQLMGAELTLLWLNNDIKTEPSARLQKFQSLIQPVAPQWRELLLPLTPRTAFKGTLQIKVSLGTVWRRFTASSTATLEDLASKILTAFQFDSDHLYAFRVPSPTGEKIEYTHYAMDEGIPAAETTLGAVPFRVRLKSIFHYDFGDDWRFDILIEAMEPRACKSIKLIESHGEAPTQYEITDEENSIDP